MKPYSSYAPFDAGWISSLPAHWSALQVKYVCTYNDEVLLDNTDANAQIEYVEISDVDEVNGLKGTESMAFKDAPSRARRLVRDGDIIISTVRTYLRAVAPIKNPPENLVVSTGFAVVRPEGLLPGFARYALVADGFVGSVIARSTGVSYPAINASDLVRISVPVPPIDEQRAIASYLDAETARIDELIDEKQRLSDVLAELRASVMGEAIQRGLRPDAKVVESGVPWLGDVPAHWRVLRLKHLLDGIEQGWSPQCDSRQAEDHEWGVLKAGACNGGVFHPEEQKALQAGMAADPSIEVKPGDVLMSRASGSLDLVGSVAHVDDVRPGLMLSDKIFRLKIDESQGTSSKWLAMTFNTPAQRRQIASHVGGAEGLARNITSSAIMELWLAVPPPEEQMAIVEHVTGRVAHIDELTKAVGAEIALLQELRSATITDAVLGRIDVREHMKH